MEHELPDNHEENEPKETKIKKIKAHIGKHKVVYTIGTSVVIGGILFYTGVRVGSARIAGPIATNEAGTIVGDQVINIITVIKRAGPGHPGYPVMNTVTKEWWKSARECAKAEGISYGVLRGNLNGKFPDVNGTPYTYISLVPTPVAA